MRYPKKDMYKLNDEFGENLNRIRKNRQLTQSELGEQAGMSRRTIMRYENGDVKYAPKEHVRKLSNILGYDFDTVRLNDSGLNLLGDYERRAQSAEADYRNLRVENESLKHQVKLSRQQIIDLQIDNKCLRTELENLKNLQRG